MRRTREILRMRLGLGQSERLTAQSCGVGKSTVRDCIQRFVRAGLSWPLGDDVDDDELETRLYRKAALFLAKGPTPDWALVSLELRRPGVTRRLLWQEYIDQNPDGLSYSRYCELYFAWRKKSRLSMRQSHQGGEKLLVDFAGATIPIHDGGGQPRAAQVFVATWGASNYTYAEAVAAQDLTSWTQCHVHAFEYFGVVPRIVVPDNLKAGVTKACRYDPDINETYTELADHYGFAVIPTRVAKPKDKAKVEYGVLLVTRWIIAALRKRRFFSIDEVNTAIQELLERLNAKPFQKLPGSRRSAFLQLDKPAALALTSERYVYADVIAARVNIDYHVVLDEHFYSVPYQLRGEKIRARMTATTIEILHRNRRIATHVRSYKKWDYTTFKEHMPKSHREHAAWSPSRIIDWAGKCGPHTAKLVAVIIEERRHPEQGYRAALGIIRLADHYGRDRLEAAALRALSFGAHRYRYVKSILERGLDRAVLTTAPPSKPIVHENIRGGDYYSHTKETGNADP